MATNSIRLTAKVHSHTFIPLKKKKKKYSTTLNRSS